MKAARPGFVEPMKALGVEEVPGGSWRLEIKFDGYRAIAVISGGKVELWSRNRISMSAKYTEVTGALRSLRCRSAVLDGEIAALNEAGQSRFQLLQQRDVAASRPDIVYFVFDLLHLDGRSLLATPLEERQKLLARLVPRAGGPIRLSPVFDVPPAKLLAEVTRRGLEGIVAKASGSLYQPGRRSGAWVKRRVSNEQEFVIAGCTAPAGSRRHFGALLLGYYDHGKLTYAGKVGTGFDEATLASLARRFADLRLEKPPFSGMTPQQARDAVGTRRSPVTWLRPAMVAQIRFSEWTGDGLLRHPVYLGLRQDKKPKDVVREAAAG